MDDLAALVAGEPDAIARHAEHLASCDACRDARHDATQLADKLSAAGADHVPDSELAERVLAKLDAQAAPTPAAPVVKHDAPVAAKPAEAKPVEAKPAPVRDIATARGKRRLWIVAGAAAALAAGVVGVAMMKRGGDAPAETSVAATGPIGKVKTISRAATE
ncbi:MAG TPA: hypothetical protein VFS15_02645, partial [Kofleriaceae bacterium]|nr:hypothetical protein [Kofleriaceae bacterium]